MKKAQKMKHIISLFTVAVFFAVSCVPTFEEVGELPDDPGIKEILVGNENGLLPQENTIDFDQFIDTVFIKDRTADYTNVYVQANIEKGCTVEPLEGTPAMGVYGDFSAPQKYRVTAPNGNTAEWTIVLAEYIPEIGCLADRWAGAVTCMDDIYPSYSPASCVGEKIGNDCKKLNITFDFWADGSAVVTCELQFGDIDYDTLTGKVTLLNDVTFTSYGDDMTFHAGDAGTYNALSNELHLTFNFSGYDIGGGTYNFTISQP